MAILNRTELASALKIASRIAKTGVRPVLSCIRLWSNGNAVTLQATDLETWYTRLLSTTDEIDTILPAKLLNDIVQRSTSEEVEIKVATQRATIKVGSAQYRTGVMDTGDWPSVEEKELFGVMVGEETLQSVIRKVATMCSKDEYRPALTGVHCVLRDGTLTFTATDGHRLARLTVPSEGEWEGIIPQKAFGLAANYKGATEIALGDGMTKLNNGKDWLTVRNVEGGFPDAENIMNTEATYTITANREELLGALERMAFIGEVVEMRHTGVSMHLATSGDNGEAEETVSVVSEGEGSLGYNVKYLVDGLKAFESEDIALGISGRTSPTLITQVGGTPGYRYVLMPLRREEE